jgi:hypothetical protein
MLECIALLPKQGKAGVSTPCCTTTKVLLLAEGGKWTGGEAEPHLEAIKTHQKIVESIDVGPWCSLETSQEKWRHNHAYSADGVPNGKTKPERGITLQRCTRMLQFILLSV